MLSFCGGGSRLADPLQVKVKWPEIHVHGGGWRRCRVSQTLTWEVQTEVWGQTEAQVSYSVVSLRQQRYVNVHTYAFSLVLLLVYDFSSFWFSFLVSHCFINTPALSSVALIPDELMLIPVLCLICILVSSCLSVTIFSSLALSSCPHWFHLCLVTHLALFIECWLGLSLVKPLFTSSCHCSSCRWALGNTWAWVCLCGLFVPYIRFSQRLLLFVTSAACVLHLVILQYLTTVFLVLVFPLQCKPLRPVVTFQLQCLYSESSLKI